jgi:hypothetical protein
MGATSGAEQLDRAEDVAVRDRADAHLGDGHNYLVGPAVAGCQLKPTACWS